MFFEIELFVLRHNKKVHQLNTIEKVMLSAGNNERTHFLCFPPINNSSLLFQNCVDSFNGILEDI